MTVQRSLLEYDIVRPNLLSSPVGCVWIHASKCGVVLVMDSVGVHDDAFTLDMRGSWLVTVDKGRKSMY